MALKIEINESIQKKLDEDIKKKLFKKEVRDLIAFWMIELQEIGYDEYISSPLAKSPGDHRLKAPRQGERAIILNTQGGRLIYKYFKNRVVVKVIKISPDHDYS